MPKLITSLVTKRGSMYLSPLRKWMNRESELTGVTDEEQWFRPICRLVSSVVALLAFWCNFSCIFSQSVHTYILPNS